MLGIPLTRLCSLNELKSSRNGRLLKVNPNYLVKKVAHSKWCVGELPDLFNAAAGVNKRTSNSLMRPYSTVHSHLITLSMCA